MQVVKQLEDLPENVKRSIMREMEKKPEQQVRQVRDEVVKKLEDETGPNVSLEAQLLKLLPRGHDIAKVEEFDDLKIVYHKGKADIIFIPDIFAV